ncbi:MAG: glycerophosphodiester phosphodiesterase family protein [Alphaproteobacteria bacterium]|nr:glycerophosphodiester phosphodiesterase family protein [Alphaproteobacteria bacterium]
MAALEWLCAMPFAHRGLHEEGVPENSLAAFEAALRAGYGIELDVRLAADGVPVVFHDASLERLTGRAGPVSAFTSAELARFRLGDSDQRIPRLEEVLALVRGAAPLLVEIKNPRHRAGALEAAVWALLEGYPGPVAALSFNPITLAWFRRRAPALARGHNLSAPSSRQRGGRARASARLARLLARPHFISHEITSLSHRRAARIRGHGLTLIAWTVRGESEQTKALRYADNFMFEGLRPMTRGSGSARDHG